MSYAYGPVDDAESTQLLRRAVDLGVTLFDTADIYGFGHTSSSSGAPWLRYATSHHRHQVRHRARVGQ